MSSIPLAIRPAPVTDPMDQYARAQGILSLINQQRLQGQQIQENQQRIQQNQLSLNDQKAASDAMHQWDGQDIEDLPSLYIKNGASASAVLSLKNSILDQQTKRATLDKDTLENDSKRHDNIAGAMNAAVIQDKDRNMIPEATAQAIDSLGRNPDFIRNLSRNEVQQLPARIEYFKTLAQTNPDQFQQEWRVAANEHLAESQISQNALNQAKTNAQNVTPQRFAAEQNPQSPLYAPTPASLNLKAAQGDTLSTLILGNQAKQAGAVAGAQEAAKFPYEQKLETIRQQVAQSQQINRDAQDKIETNVLKPYEDKMSSIGELQSAVDQASSGNVAAARGVLLKLMGVTNPDGTKRYNEAEASRMLSMGSVPQRIAGSVKNLLTGDNWTDQMASDIRDFANGQAQVANGNLSRGISNVNRLYNTNVGTGLIPTSGGSTPAGSSLPRGGGRVIDKATAQQFYNAAGRDPDRARQLAIQNGWQVQ